MLYRRQGDDHERYAFLDGVRGVAATLVMILHTQDYWQFRFYRSYLAVDLFFLLSGFVIAHAYDRRLITREINTWQFFKIRLIRLYPYYFLSILLMSIALAWSDHRNAGIVPIDISGQSLVILATCLLIPLKYPGSDYLFPVNGLYWSLFFEIVSNLVYSIFRPLLTTPVLICLICLSFALLIPSAIHHENLDIGPLRDAESVAAGFLRSVYGIFLGVLIQRHRQYLARRIGTLVPAWLACFLLGALCASPQFQHFNWLFDLLAIGIFFPALVFWASLSEPAKFKKVLLTLGLASYPIYVLSVPVSLLIEAVLPVRPRMFAPVAGMLLTALLIGASVWLERAYDIPVRSRLSRWFLGTRPVPAAVGEP